MKTIELSDEDHAALIAFSEELQRQENDWQAFPYFWEPRSTKDGIGTEDDTPIVYDSNACETYSFEEYAESNDERFAAFLLDIEMPEDSKYEDIDETEWMHWISGSVPDADIVYSREEQISEHNFSLFKSDVKDFITGNYHHLGRDPHTYARTIFRMTKMERLVKIIYGLATVPEEDINHEAKHYIVKG